MRAKTKFVAFVGFVGFAGGLFFALQLGVTESPQSAANLAQVTRAPNSVNASSSFHAKPVSKPEIEFQDLNLGAALNAPNKTVRDDLALLDSIFSVWQTNFSKEGNPVGENVEITAALSGANALRVAFISPRSAAINTRGELCDRWGTPFIFHQISGAQMQIVSAGPDRVRHTSDDIGFTP